MRHSGITKIYVTLMFTLFLFFTGFGGYTSVFSAKTAVFFMLSIAYAVIYFVIGLPKGKLSRYELCALIFLAISALSAVFSRHFPETLVGASRNEGLFTVAMYVCIFILVSRSWEKPKYFEELISAVMILESVVVVLQRLDFNALWLYPKGEYYSLALEKYNGEFISTIGNADLAGAFFALMTPVTVIFALYHKEHRALHIASAVMSLVALVGVNVESGILAFAFCVFISPLILMPRRRKAVIAVMSVFILSAVILLYFLPFDDGTFYEIQQMMKGNFDPKFGSGRLHIWQKVLSSIEFPFGVGPDTMLREGLDPFRKVIDGVEVTMRIDIAHNDYLNILYHQGIFALLAYLGILSLMIKWYKKSRDSVTVTAVGMGIVGYLVQVFFGYSACSSSAFLWIMLGVLNGEIISTSNK